MAVPQPPGFSCSLNFPRLTDAEEQSTTEGPPEGPCADSPAQPRKQPAAWQCWEEVGLGEHLGPTIPYSWSPTLCQEHRRGKTPMGPLAARPQCPAARSREGSGA